MLLMEPSGRLMSPTLFDTMRAALQPQGSATVVRIGFDGPPGNAYFDKDFVHECLDTPWRSAVA